MILSCSTAKLCYASGVDANTVSQMVTVASAVLAIIWHQQRSTDKLRDRLDSVERRLSGIEGFLGVGMLPAAATRRAGASQASEPASTASQPTKPDGQD